MRYSLCIACLVLAACASPAVDMSASGFDERKFESDLDECRGGTALAAMAQGLGGAVAGSVLGLTEGALYGAVHGDGKEGAVIGTVVGGAVGFVLGSYEPIRRQEVEIKQCLTGKGYALLL